MGIMYRERLTLSHNRRLCNLERLQAGEYGIYKTKTSQRTGPLSIPATLRFRTAQAVEISAVIIIKRAGILPMSQPCHPITGQLTKHAHLPRNVTIVIVAEPTT